MNVVVSGLRNHHLVCGVLLRSATQAKQFQPRTSNIKISYSLWRDPNVSDWCMKKYTCIHKINVCSVAKDVCQRHSTRVLTTEYINDIVKIPPPSATRGVSGQRGNSLVTRLGLGSNLSGRGHLCTFLPLFLTTRLFTSLSGMRSGARCACWPLVPLLTQQFSRRQRVPWLCV